MARGPQVHRNTDSPTQERSERAREILQLAEYLVPDVRAHPEHAPDALASLREWADEEGTLSLAVWAG